MEPNKRYDRYRDDDNRTSNFNSGYNRGDFNERNQGYPDSRFNQYNQRNNPDQYADDRYRNENPYGMNTGYTSSGPNPYSGQYGYNPDPYRNDWQQGNRNYDYRESGNDWRSREDYKRNRHDNDRNWWDKTTDEVSSWFGDEEAKRRRRMDEINDGMHKGKGPKNYTRSSEKIREDVCEILSDDSHTDASDIDVSVKGTEVTLTGTVESRMMKRRAEDLVERVSGVSHVQNNLRVKEQGTWTDNMASTGSAQSYESAGKNEMSSKTSHTTDSKFSRNAHREQLS